MMFFKNNEAQLRELALKLFDIEAFKFGDFKMKVGVNSPVYFDLRVIVSHPDIMENLSNLLSTFMKSHNLSFDHVCGVPYTALPLATILSVNDKIPMLIRRKEAKSYGTKKLIEGRFQPNDRCLIIEDVVTSGSSILETVNDLTDVGIKVTDVIVVVDREQGGMANIEEQHVKTHALFTLSYLLNVLLEAGKINAARVESVNKYISSCQIKKDGSFKNGNGEVQVVNELDRKKMPFAARLEYASSPIAKKLFRIMVEKESNLCVAADLTTASEILDLATLIGPHICVLKTHVDIITDFDENFVKNLKSLAEKHNFLLMEDRKFADIGNTVALQFSEGIYKIGEWADLVTVHSLPGASILKALKQAMRGDREQGVFLLSEMSSSGNLITPKYVEDTMRMATEGADKDVIAGIVCQSPTTVVAPGLLQLTPGCQINESNDELGQQYATPDVVVKEKGADVVVVGRGITKAKNAEETAKVYKEALWNAYMERIIK